MSNPTTTRCIFSYANETIEDFSASLRPFAPDVKQLSKGSFNGRSTLIALPDCTMIKRCASASFYSSCWVPQAAIFVFPYDDREAYVQGRVCGAGKQIGSLGNHEVRVVVPQNYSHLLVTLPLEALATYLSPAESCLFIETLATIENGMVDESLKMATTRRLLATFERIEASEAMLTPALKKEFCRSIVNVLFDYLSSHSRVDLVRASNQEKILARALNLIASQPMHFFTLDELSREAYASKRAVQYAFSRILGLSPMRFQKLYRLNLVRGDIRLAQAPVKMTAITPKHFFSNPGRMSREYAELFGERPAETLRQALAGALPRGSGMTVA